jgi:aspartyl-tRNA(Asn)/glutamyl-tRNA(Gln) amidotransferase subunit A
MGTPALDKTIGLFAQLATPAAPCLYFGRNLGTYGRQAHAPFNLTGNPAVAVPTGFASTGLPLSMQIIGKPFDEATVYRVARAYEQATAWTSQHPTLG